MTTLFVIFTSFVLVFGAFLAYAGLAYFASAKAQLERDTILVETCSKDMLLRETAVQHKLEQNHAIEQRIQLKYKSLEAVSAEIGDRMAGKDWSLDELEGDQ